MEAQATASMADDRRALLTDREREILLGEAEDVSEKYHGVVVARVRNKIERLESDLPALEAHDSLADELREVACPDVLQQQSIDGVEITIGDTLEAVGPNPAVAEGERVEVVAFRPGIGDEEMGVILQTKKRGTVSEGFAAAYAPLGDFADAIRDGRVAREND